MEAQVEEKGEVVVVHIEGRLDAASSPQLEKQINGVIDAGHFKIVLDCTNLDYLSSAGMRLMLSLFKRLKSVEGKLVACNLKDEVMEVIKMAGFNQVLEFYSTIEESMTHL